MAAVVPLPQSDPERGLRARPSDFRRAPLQRRPMPRSTIAPSRAAEMPAPPKLEVVAPRRRRTVSVVVLGGLVLFAMLIGAVAFQTQIARNQLALDKTEKAVTAARDRYDVLRRQRAELRSPDRLAVEAKRLGMSPADTGEFMTVDPQLVASVMASASALPPAVGAPVESSLDQFGDVKAVTGDVP
ncbi:MAG: hypothetical protein JWM34_1443 [Ilumatobacteraceae bacterium]|nr:hypothetical protein [Ilumatobacteraceae bacterium]